MRLLIVALLLSSTSFPVAAQAEPERSLRSAIGERIRESRPERAAERRSEPAVRAQPAERPAPAASPRAPEQANRPEPRGRSREVSGERGRPAGVASEPRRARGSGEPSGDSVRDWRLRERLARQGQLGAAGVPATVTPEQAVRDGLTGRLRERDVRREAERRERDARPPVYRDFRDRRGLEGFRRDWRRDARYDWRRHRDRFGDRFHLGFYYDPFGWDYRRWQVGWNIRPSYWSDSYWLQDPWQWRLPMVAGPYRWIRYYDDALLVDVRSGRVVDVIHDVFW